MIKTRENTTTLAVLEISEIREYENEDYLDSIWNLEVKIKGFWE